ncbi:MAG: hypothetical protein PVH79_04960, partial [Candidatus Bathyarchaeota archaeon]
GDRIALIEEVSGLLANRNRITDQFLSCPAVAEILALMDKLSPVESKNLVNGLEEQLRRRLDGVEPEIVEEYRLSALEFLANSLITNELLRPFPEISDIYIPKRMES